MKCEQVFEILCQTDTHAEASPAVREHLTSCAECAQLAAALKPGVQRLREASVQPVPTSSTAFTMQDAPWLHDVAPEPLANVKPATPSTDKPRRGRESGWPGRDFWQVTSMALLVALAFTAFQLHGHGTSSRQVTPANQVKYQPDEAGRHALAEMKLPADCLGGESSQPFFAAQGEAMLQCCTSCHSAATKQRPSVNLVAVLQNSCQACHISQ